MPKVDEYLTECSSVEQSSFKFLPLTEKEKEEIGDQVIDAMLETDEEQKARAEKEKGEEKKKDGDEEKKDDDSKEKKDDAKEGDDDSEGEEG